jgi:hyperosmotically inducible periplasmic protein
MKQKLQKLELPVCVAVLVLLFAVGCNKNRDSGMESSDTNATVAAADNSANNARDRHNATLTPGDQGNSAADLDITQKIRQALVSGTNNISGSDTTNLTMTAQNVKIITSSGKVTLRGPVNNAGEKSEIELIAKNVAGAANVDDQLEVKSNQ